MINAHQIKKDICEIGQRIYNKGFAAANDGNITVRISDNEVLCTPTMHSKGFLKPDDISSIDMTGKQISGRKKRSSEALLHLEIYKQRPDIKSVVHCHPPHATAFAIAREPIPQCVLPEVEVFLGDVPITRYETPGGQAFADTIIPFVDKCNVMILANHGTVSFGENVERAYWWTEILDAYCRMLLLAIQLSHYLFRDQFDQAFFINSGWGGLNGGSSSACYCRGGWFHRWWCVESLSFNARGCPTLAEDVVRTNIAVLVRVRVTRVCKAPLILQRKQLAAFGFVQIIDATQ